MNISRNAQGLDLGLGRVAATTTGTLTGTLDATVLLQDVIIDSDQDGLIDDIKVSGQSVWCSDKGGDINAFKRDAQVEGHRGLGIALVQNQTVTVDYTLDAAGKIAGSVGTDPVNPEAFVPVNQLGSALDYAGGLGNVSVAGASAGVLSCTVRRPVMLGRLILSPESDAIDIVVTSVKVNNIELLSGGGEVPIAAFAHDCTDVDGCVLGYPVETNDTLQISLHNYNVAARKVKGTFFVLPDVDPVDQAA